MHKNRVFLFLSLLWITSLVSAQFENPVSWKYKIKETGLNESEVVFTASINPPWHVYAIHLEKEGPIPTAFTFEPGESVELAGELKELTKPIVKYDEGFKFNVGMYARSASFSQTIRNLGEKTGNLKVSIEFQCCNDETCLPPFLEEFSIAIPAGKPAALAHKSESKADTESLVKDDTQAPQENADESTGEVTPETVIVEAGGQASAVPVENPVREEKQSLLVFLIIAFIAGLAAILTPCVFPMIPMTISYFMRGSENRGPSILKGIVFGSSMVLVYTGIGALVSLTGMNADIGIMLSTHWIPNILFFLIFMVFAASFLGMFELVLPSGLVNRADKNADRGGLTGSFFMGVTTVLVSFSCTGPIVGSLLIEAAGGEVLKPILGMFSFSLAFALPFTILAIFPSMLKNLPKSGGWLNSVKVVLGFIVLGFGLKFLSNIDQSYHLGIFSREIYLGIWLIISVMVGMYFLGKIKFAHDSDTNFVTVPRLVLSMMSFVFAIYLLTGIFGADLKSISSLIPPKSASAFHFSTGNSVSAGNDRSFSYCGPGKHDDLFELPLGLEGYFDFEDGLKCARTNNKPVFLDFTGHFCSNCKQMENQVWPDPVVLRLLKEEFVIISLYTDDKTRLEEAEWVTGKDGKVIKTLGDKNKNFEIEKFNTLATPLYALLDVNGNLLVEPIGKNLDPGSFAAYLQSGLDAFKEKTDPGN